MLRRQAASGALVWVVAMWSPERTPGAHGHRFEQLVRTLWTAYVDPQARPGNAIARETPFQPAWWANIDATGG